MEMQQLRHLIAAADHGSLHRAAEVLRLTQPALTHSIRRLEQTVGAPLFERSSRGVILTEVGRSLVARGRLILNEARLALDEANALRNGGGGTTTIAVSDNFSDFLLPDAVSATLQRDSSIAVTIVAGFFDENLARLRRAEVDMVFGLFAGAVDAPDLVGEPLTTSTFRVFARADHPLAGAGHVDLAQLTAHAWLVVAEQPIITRLFQSFFEQRGLATPRQAVRTSSIASVRPLLLATGLLTILPEELVRHEVASGAIVAIGQDELVVTLPAGLVTRARGSQSAASRLLMRALREASRRPTEGGIPGQV